MTETEMIDQIFLALEAWNSGNGVFSDVSYDGDHKSAEVLVCADGKQIFIHSDDVEQEEDEI